MKRTMWMVRSASGGSLADSFHEKNIVAIGWGDVGDLNKYKDKEALIAAVKANWSEWSDGRVMSSASQLIRFRDEVTVDDRVVTYDSSRRIYHVGTIKGEYKYSSNLLPPYENTRAVKWDGEVDRDKLSVSARNSLGSTLTLFRVTEFAADEIESLLKGKTLVKSNRDEAEA